MCEHCVLVELSLINYLKLTSDSISTSTVIKKYVHEKLHCRESIHLLPIIIRILIVFLA